MVDLPYRPCAGVMLINADGLVFVGERIDTPGAWQMPQGGIDQEEEPLEAALRELEEEIGVPAKAVTVLAVTDEWVKYELPPHLLGKMWRGRYRGQIQFWALMRLNGPDSLITIDTAHPEFRAWKWAPVESLVDGIVDFKREAYAQVVRQLAPKIKTPQR